MTPRAALISLHAAVLLFGLSGLIGKAVHSPALVVTCLRSLVGALAIAMLLAIRREKPVAAWRGRRGLLLAGGALLAHACFTASLSRVRVAVVGVVAASVTTHG